MGTQWGAQSAEEDQHQGPGTSPKGNRASCSQRMPRDAWAPPLVPGAAVAQRAIREPGTVSEQGTEAHQWPHQPTRPASGLRPVSLRPHGPLPALPPEDRVGSQAVPRVGTWSLGCAGPSRRPTSFDTLPLPAEPLQAPEAAGERDDIFPSIRTSLWWAEPPFTDGARDTGGSGRAPAWPTAEPTSRGLRDGVPPPL